MKEIFMLSMSFRPAGILALGLAFLTSVANASVLGLLFIGNGEQKPNSTKTGLAVERDNNGDFFMLLEMNKNGKRVEYGLAPGSRLEGTTVVKNPLGLVTAVLSIMSGEKYGWVNSKNVTMLDPKLERTQQRTNLTKDIESMAKEGLFQDENGKTYTAEEIREIALVFQVPSVMDKYETTSTYVHFPFGKFAEFEQGTVKQLAGETVLPKTLAKPVPVK